MPVIIEFSRCIGTYSSAKFELYIENPATKLSSEIAKKYNKSSMSIERAMANAINKAWESSDIDDLEKYYTARIDILRGSPTIMEFVSYYADKIKSENVL